MQDRRFRAENRRPILYLFSSPTCPACVGLKQSLALSDDFARLSHQFVLVLVERQEEAAAVSRV